MAVKVTKLCILIIFISKLHSVLYLYSRPQFANYNSESVLTIHLCFALPENESIRMSNAATRLGSWRENSVARSGRQTNLPRTGNNPNPCCRPAYGQYPRSRWLQAADTCTALCREAA